MAKLYLYFDLAPGETAMMADKPGCLFKPERLVLPKEQASSVLVHSLRVGKWIVSPPIGEGSLPGAAFLDAEDNKGFNADVTFPDTPISLTLSNITESRLSFTAEIQGKELSDAS